jgi:hypothetical protein
MGIRDTARIRITRRSAGILSIQEIPSPKNSISHLLRSISRHGSYPVQRWADMDSADVEGFNAIVDAAIEENLELVQGGENTDTAPGATFQNLISAPFKVDGKEYSIFITRQTSPKDGKLYYREISILENEDRDLADPRPSRLVTLVPNAVRVGVIGFIQRDEDCRDMWWQLKKTWNFLKRFDGRVDFF